MGVIYTFSSTGNSLYVAKKIAEKESSRIVSMASSETVCNDDVIGFVFPTYFMGLPQTVKTFVDSLEITNKNAYLYAITTYGDTTFSVTGAIQNILKTKGLSLCYAAEIKCVENYTPMYPQINDNKEMHESTDTAIECCAVDICSRKTNKIPRYTFLNKLIYRRYPAAKNGQCGMRFTVTNCIHCGLCATACQRHNISIKDGKPEFGTNCELCLGCLHICPQHAINWNNKTENRARYRNPHITQQELLSFMSDTRQR